MENKNVCAIIPCLNPDEKFIAGIENLRGAGFEYIIVVNDGSTEEYLPYFDRAAEMGCTVLRHNINLGKGRALKTAFNHYLNESKGCTGAVTVDADGQHTAEDVSRCAAVMKENPNCMIIGCRDFSSENVPKKSRVGNRVMCAVFKMFCGIDISDTQTGLHAMSNVIIPQLMEISGERFEYESNLLLDMKKKDISLKEVKIKTVYIEDNKSSHFRPVRDSVRIASIIIKFLASSLSTAILDFVLFALIISLLSFMRPIYGILISTVLARIASSFCNYIINKNLVFPGKSQRRAMVRYYALAAVVMGLSYVGVMALSYIGVDSVVAKIPVDLLLFVLSFTAQREWVFK